MAPGGEIHAQRRRHGLTTTAGRHVLPRAFWTYAETLNVGAEQCNTQYGSIAPLDTAAEVVRLARQSPGEGLSSRAPRL